MESEMLALIEQLEALLNLGGRVPLSARMIVNAPEAFRLLDLMRQSLPREIVRARHIFQERDRLLGEARIEAEQIRAAAQAEREALLAEHAITVEAIRQTEARKREARLEGERLRMEADAYAMHSLRDLQVQLIQARADLDATLKTVAGGMELLEGRAAHSAYSGPHPALSPLPSVGSPSDA